MKILLLLLVLQWYSPSADSIPVPQNKGLNSQPDDPTFTASNPIGWTPVCPAPKTVMVRKDIQPNCIWGTKEMTHKPSWGQFKCVPKKEYKRLKKCGVDPYFDAGIGLH